MNWEWLTRLTVFVGALVLVPLYLVTHVEHDKFAAWRWGVPTWGKRFIFLAVLIIIFIAACISFTLVPVRN